MKALIQRVQNASVMVKGQTIGEINQGILLFLGIEKNDDKEQAKKLCHKVIHYRLFSDVDDKMNLSLLDCKKELLIISQFTLVADTRKGMRASFSSAKAPEEAVILYDYFIEQAQQHPILVATGLFQANMQISLVNDGPVTFLLAV